MCVCSFIVSFKITPFLLPLFNLEVKKERKSAPSNDGCERERKEREKREVEKRERKKIEKRERERIEREFLK